MSDLIWLSAAQMRRIAPYFPLSHGVPRVDDRRVVSGIIFVIRNGLRWRDALRWPQLAGQVGGEDKLFPGSIMPPVAGSTPSPGHAPATVSSRSHCMSRRACAQPAKNVAAAYYNG
jgi:hypothetical protein